MEPSERRRFRALAAGSAALGLVEALGVVSVLPFIAIAANPSALQRQGLFSRTIATFVPTDPHATLLVLGAGSFLTLLLGVTGRAALLHAHTRFGRLLGVRLGATLLKRYLTRPYVWFLNRNSSVLSADVIIEVEQVVRGSVLSGLRLVASAAVTLSIIVALLLVDPWSALATGGIIGAAYGATFILVRRRIRELGLSRSKCSAQRQVALAEALGGVKEVKLFGVERTALDRYAEPAGRLAEAQAGITLIEQTPRHALEVAVFGAMILFVLWSIERNDLGLVASVPTLGLFAVAGVRLFPVIQQMFSSAAQMRYSRPAVERLLAELAQPCLPLAAPATPMSMREAVEFHRVVFRYAGSDGPALADLSFRIPARSVVGVAGATGAGKSTLVDLLLGLLTPDSGELRVDGRALQAGDLASWQRSIGYVPQQIFLADASVAANIAFGAKDIEANALERAARTANISSFIEKLPDGYRTRIGERGVRLSGGQRQRIGIARALYRDPEILVFDEATSALDGATEDAVMDAVDALGGHKTVVIVAHRMSLLRPCDTILLLEGGHLVASGSHDELIACEPRFRALQSKSAPARHSSVDRRAELAQRS